MLRGTCVKGMQNTEFFYFLFYFSLLLLCVSPKLGTSSGMGLRCQTESLTFRKLGNHACYFIIHFKAASLSSGINLNPFLLTCVMWCLFG
jgi:hypothetical protein